VARPLATADRLPWTPERVRITAGLLVALFLAAIDGTVVATAVPTIAGELGRFALYPWVIAGYLLTSTTTVPLWGRLADIRGRRRVLLAGLAWFVACSLLCGAAPSMEWLVVFRALQGVGAGCLLPVVLTTVGDLFPLAQRARLQGMFSSVWAVAALAGPALGALFVSTIGWRWIFWINLPIGVAAAVLLGAHRDAPPGTGRERLDYTGAALLTAGLGLVLFGLDGGTAGGAPSWPLAGAGLAALAAFALTQRRTAHQTIPLSLLRHRVIGPATAAAFFAGTLMFGLTAFLPLYVQGVLRGTSYQAGAALSVASLGWSGAALVSGRLLLRVGYQRLIVTGALSMVAGSLALLVAPPGFTLLWIAAAAGVVGAGMGQLQTPLLIVIQNVVDWGSRGAATALNQFSRTIGGAVGVTLMGLLLTSRVGPRGDANPLGAGGHLDAGAAPLVADGLHLIFWLLLGVAVVTLAIAVAILTADRDRTVV
jgi:EmrB/QacA subfamily drug resistance transporter